MTVIAPLVAPLSAHLSALVLAAPSPRVVLHCGELQGARLDRRVHEALQSLPDGVRVIVTVLHSPARKTAVLRKVDVLVIPDGGLRLITELVARDDLVIVIPPNARLQSGWFEEVQARAEAQPHHIGVMTFGSQHLFVYPGPTRSMDAPRHGWSAVSGLGRRPSGSSTVRRTLGAVLIVKDEERVLASCLEAIEPFVDQVVVYDTGSSDATRAIARERRAHVVEGYWDNDFAAARNRALLHSTTDWVLSIDADELIDGNIASLRDWVDEADGTVAMVEIVSTQWDGARDGHRSRSVRLFQREGQEWSGALHEQVVASAERPDIRSCTSLPPVTLIHSGYRSAEAIDKDKRQRNLEISRTALQRREPGSEGWGDACVDYGRSLALAGRLDECVEALSPVLEHAVKLGQLVQASRTVLPLLIHLQRFEEAAAWIERIDGNGESAGQVAIWKGQVAAARGDVRGALAIIQPFAEGRTGGGIDVWGQRMHPDSAPCACATIELQAGDARSAVDRMIPVLHRSPDTVPLLLLMRSTLMAGHSLEDLAQIAPPQFIERTAREIFTACPDVALLWLTACRGAHPADRSIVVAGSVAAARTGLPEALEWSMHAREHGLDVCALRLLADDDDVPHAGRLGAWALLLHGFLDESARRPLVDLLATADEGDAATALTTLQSIVPGARSLA